MVKKLLALAGAYLSLWGLVGFLWFDWTQTAAERGRHAVALGEQQAALLPPPQTLGELAQACKGRLEPGEPHSIAAYVAKTPVKPDDGLSWDEVLVGIDGSPSGDVVRERPEGFGPTGLAQALRRTANPLEWSRLLPGARSGRPPLADARYLVVAKYFSLAPPVNEGTEGYTRGGGAFSARVIGLGDGEVHCQGRGEVRMKETVDAAGRGQTREAAQADAFQNAAKMVPFVFSLSVTTSPLHALCDVGGEGLCRLTGRWVGR